MAAQPLGKPKDVGEYLQLSEKTLENYRLRGEGPPFVKVSGGVVRYRWCDVETWLEGQTRGTEVRAG